LPFGLHLGQLLGMAGGLLAHLLLEGRISLGGTGPPSAGGRRNGRESGHRDSKGDLVHWVTHLEITKKMKGWQSLLLSWA
jgi:hypothetical protein